MTEGVFSIHTGEDISGLATDEDMDRLSAVITEAVTAASNVIEK